MKPVKPVRQATGVKCSDPLKIGCTNELKEEDIFFSSESCVSCKLKIQKKSHVTCKN